MANMKEILGHDDNSLFLWIPFIVAFGAALYFTMPNEPNVTHPVMAFIAGMIILLFGKMNFILRGAMLFLCGFLYAVFYTHTLVDTPILKHDIRDIEITAPITDIDVSDDKSRIVLSVPGHDLNLTVNRNAKIRLTVNDNYTINVGDIMRAKVSLFTPASMEAPESFDYARWAFFNDLTATGFIKDYEILNHYDTTSIHSIRNTIHEKAQSFLTDSLVLGYKNAVPKSDKQIWATNGVGHIWAISGFHLSLIGGWLFAFFYLICRSIGFITKRIPARIVATILSWSLLLFYVCISGAQVATLRAFFMLSLVCIALLFGRNIISMRNIAIVFLILFLLNPHFVTQVGFQLSFAAVFGLVWFFEDKSMDKNQNFFHKIKSWVYLVGLVSIIATVFTLPFIATHFNYVPVYSIIGNLVFVPIFSVLIMPLVLCGTMCALFGGHLFLRIATNIYNISLNWAQKISDLPMANLNMPHIPETAFVFFIIGFLFLMLIHPIKTSKYWLARKLNGVLFGICLLIGCVIIVYHPHPVFYVTPDHELIGMVYDGKLEFNKARASNHYFAFDAFRKLNGELPSITNVRRKCPDGVCIYTSDNFTVAYIQKFIPLQKHFSELCNDNNINFIVSYFDISAPRCDNKILHGGFVIYKSGHIQYTPTNRWWHNPHE